MITVPAPLPFMVMLHAAPSRDHASVYRTSCLSILHNCMHLALVADTLAFLRISNAKPDISRKSFPAKNLKFHWKFLEIFTLSTNIFKTLLRRRSLSRGPSRARQRHRASITAASQLSISNL